MQIPDYLIYDDIERRKRRREHDSGLQRLELPLYDPQAREPVEDEDDAEDSNRGVTIIDMNTGLEIA